MMIKIGIADDHQLFRKSLMYLIREFKDIEVVLEVANGQELLDQLPDHQIDILLLDLQMPVLDGFEATKKVQEKYPDIKIMILTQLKEEDTIYHMIDLGVQGYFTKHADPNELEYAIRQLHQEGYYFERSIVEIINKITEFPRSPKYTEKPVSFTDREIDIIMGVIQENSSVDIAEKYNISYKTVDKHKSNMIEKTESKNFVGVIMYAIRNGIIDPKSLK